MQTSIVIPLGTGSRWNNTELRFALRSVEKHLTGYGDIFIIGEKPDWLTGVTHIPATDIEQTWAKEANIYRKIMLACEDPRVTDDFLFMNDDHFLLQDYVAGEFPTYIGGLLSDEKKVSDYKKTLHNTILELGPYCSYADVHCPVVYSKSYFPTVFEKVDWAKPFGFCIKTVYYNRTPVPDVVIELPDLKINQPLPYADIIKLIAGRPWFSIGDAARQGEMLEVLEDLYSVKSKYEK